MLASRIFCDNKALPKLEGKSFKEILRLNIFYRVESLPLKNSHVEKFDFAEIGML